MSGSAPTSTRGKPAEKGPSPRPTSAGAVNGPTPPEGAPKVVVSNEKVMGSDAQDSKVDSTAETKGGPEVDEKKNQPAVLARPPIRPPVPAASKSKFELEPNPFEQSFSRSSTSGQSHPTPASRQSSSAGDKHGDNDKTEASDSRDDAAASASKRSRHDQEGSHRRTPTTALPPVSALTSPASLEPGNGPHFSWSGLSSSLRAGPLSPAMLTGPAENRTSPHGASGNKEANGSAQNDSNNSNGISHTPLAGGSSALDPATFRTGFTPGGGSGFTPGFGSMMGLGSMMNGLGSFPLPSPNTAAFLNMVTNNTPGGATGNPGGASSSANGQIAHGDATKPGGGGGGSSDPAAGGSKLATSQQLAQHGPPGSNQLPDITPNTLNALTGVINQMDREEQQRENDRRYSADSNNQYSHPAPSQQPRSEQQQQQQQHAQQRQQPPPPPQQQPQQPSSQPQQGQQPQHGRPQPPRVMHHADSYFPQQPMGPVPHNNGNQNYGPHPLPPRHPHEGMAPSHLHHGQYEGSAPSGAPAPAAPGQQGAVNGLFLLSQAHQELSKREQDEDTKIGVRKKSATGGSARGSKRKSEDAAKGPAGSARSKRGKKNEVSPDYQMDDDEAEDMNAYRSGSLVGGEELGPNGKPETEEEKRKNFLERNRQAALKCRQRKKAWLNQLQTENQGLSGENDRLRSIIQNLTDEVGRLSAVLSSHRDCPGMPASMAQLGISLPPPPPPPGMQQHPHGGPPHAHGPGHMGPGMGMPPQHGMMPGPPPPPSQQQGQPGNGASQPPPPSYHRPASAAGGASPII